MFATPIKGADHPYDHTPHKNGCIAYADMAMMPTQADVQVDPHPMATPAGGKTRRPPKTATRNLRCAAGPYTNPASNVHMLTTQMDATRIYLMTNWLQLAAC
jgi:hypothetical protein